MPIQLSKEWGVLDRHSGELICQPNGTELYPEVWARNRADQLNEAIKKDSAHETVLQTKGQTH